MKKCKHCGKSCIPKKSSNKHQLFCTRICRLNFYKQSDDVRKKHAAAVRKWRSKNKDKVKEQKKSIGARYGRSRKAAVLRGYCFEITKEQFSKLCSGKCVYCGEDIGIKIGSGIDRVDNNIGYILSNCVTCCYVCNTMKRTYTKKDFLRQCSKIVEHNKI